MRGRRKRLVKEGGRSRSTSLVRLLRCDLCRRKVFQLYIFQVTQSTVDKYLDDILMNTVYTVAHEDTLMEMGVDPDTLQEPETRENRRGSQETGEKRRASTGAQSDREGAEVRGAKERSAVKWRMKATQRKYLSAAHDQIWGMIDTFKQKGEVSESVELSYLLLLYTL